MLNIPVDPEAAATGTVVVDRFRYAEAPACVTVTVCGDNPFPVTVTVAVREDNEEFTSAVTVIVALLVPLPEERVSQV
jgi:hypothetical protein